MNELRRRRLGKRELIGWWRGERKKRTWKALHSDQKCKENGFQSY